ncbi:MAG: aminomethyl-transferring glycine dehydrogenase subunit GcvPB [Spirochaetales bacterium]|nr:aminomethyl-transferring glycine dehydrogenase subunit GcvPB [Spirochaetales bacterium]
MIIRPDRRTLFESSRPGAPGYQLPHADSPKPLTEQALPSQLLRQNKAALPEVSEIEVVRHFTNLSRRNFGVDLGTYPLGSCTMKYNPKVNEDAAELRGFTHLHPTQSDEDAAGTLELYGQLLECLCELTGMDGGTLQPMAGAHGEFVGMKIFRAAFRHRGEEQRTRLLVPDSSHGTNPASAHLAGFEVVTIPSGEDGLLNPSLLDPYLDEKLAGIMLTNPSTLGLFEPQIQEVADKIHGAGGLLYYDGANFNAVMGRARPGDMGFDVVHLNVHKTLSTPHGGGGPGAGPVLVGKELLPYLPLPFIQRTESGWVRDWDRPLSIGKVAQWYGNTGVLIRAYTYVLCMGGEGLKRATDLAVLNANYLLHRLKESYNAPYPAPCKHEFVLNLKGLKDCCGVNATDIAKGLIEYGIHPPTVYFPLIVPECLMLEPTETETKESLDHLVQVMEELRELADRDPQALHELPQSSEVRRVDEVRAARHPVLSHQMRHKRPDKD